MTFSLYQQPALGRGGVARLCSFCRSPCLRVSYLKPMAASGLPLTMLPISLPIPQSRDTEVSRTLGTSQSLQPIVLSSTILVGQAEALGFKPHDPWMPPPRVSQGLGSEDFGKCQSIVFSSKSMSPGPLEPPWGIMAADLIPISFPQEPTRSWASAPTSMESASLPLEWEFSHFQTSGLEYLRTGQQLPRVIYWNPNPQLSLSGRAEQRPSGTPAPRLCCLKLKLVLLWVLFSEEQ